MDLLRLQRQVRVGRAYVLLVLKLMYSLLSSFIQFNSSLDVFVFEDVFLSLVFVFVNLQMTSLSSSVLILVGIYICLVESRDWISLL